jgi:DNA-binding protein HU-beta
LKNLRPEHSLWPPSFLEDGMTTREEPRKRRIRQERRVEPGGQRAPEAGTGQDVAPKAVRTKTQVMTHLAGNAGLQKKGVSALWDLLVRLAIEETRTGGQFTLPGLGKVVLDRRKARVGRNPQTGAPIQIPAKTALRFRFARTFKEAVMPAESAPLRVVGRRAQTDKPAKREAG